MKPRVEISAAGAICEIAQSRITLLEALFASHRERKLIFHVGCNNTSLKKCSSPNFFTHSGHPIGASVTVNSRKPSIG